MHEMRQQRQRKKAVSNRRFEGRFPAGTLDVNMNPLMVERGIGKLLDAFLRDDEPVSDSDFLTDEILETFGGVEYAFGHSVLFTAKDAKGAKKQNL